MTQVRVIRDWEWPDLSRQTPDERGIWQDIRFTVDDIRDCDYVVVLNRIPEPTTVLCPPSQLWALVQEPPVPEYRWLEQGFAPFSRVYTPETELTGEKYIHSHGALPWHLDRNYDFLKQVEVPEKTKSLSWITSNRRGRSGHRTRMAFLKQLQQKRLEFDLWGRGFTPIADKWDGLAPYNYSLAIENHSAPFYWTEKLSDCFLSWTMPIYYGCTNITDYFPAEAMVQIDISAPNVVAQVEEVIHSNRWQQHLDAIAYARELVLDKYQFFPFVAERINETSITERPQLLHLPELPNLYPRSLSHYLSRLQDKTRTVIERLSQ